MTIIPDKYLGLLIVLSIEDVKEYFISDRYIIAIAVAGLLFRIISLEFLQLLNGVISGTIIAMIIFALKKVFKQKIGNGDLKLLVAVSLSYGYAGMVNVLFFAVMIAAVYSIITLILKKKDKQSEIAFVPFITIGCILTILNL